MYLLNMLCFVGRASRYIGVMKANSMQLTGDK